MPQVIAHPGSDQDTSIDIRTAAVAWVVAAIFYFYQYVLRSAPSVMMPQLSEAFALSSTGVASILGLFYYGYSPFSLVAGTAMDRLGPRSVLPIAAAVVGIGTLLFATGRSDLASVGRVLQGAGGVFALVGAIYIATKNFPASRAATLIGATQMFGMAGGSAGQFAVGPMIGAGIAWDRFWIGMGIIGLAMGALLFALLPKEKRTEQPSSGLRSTTDAFYTVFKNPQSILCGVIAGLLFIPTTIFDMVWGVRYLQEAHGFDYASAVMRTAAVPFGWIIGCPLLGFISDRLGRRKPVIIGGALLLFACLAWILFGRPGVLPPYVNRPHRRSGVGRGNAALHRDQGNQSSAVWRHGDRRNEFSEFYLQRTFGSGLRMDASAHFRRRRANATGTLPDGLCAASTGRRHRDWPRFLAEGDRPRDSNIFL